MTMMFTNNFDLRAVFPDQTRRLLGSGLRLAYSFSTRSHDHHSCTNCVGWVHHPHLGLVKCTVTPTLCFMGARYTLSSHFLFNLSFSLMPRPLYLARSTSLIPSSSVTLCCSL